jgi:hypothetical protein
MASTDVPELLRQAVRERARGRCEYCLMSEALSGIRCQVDHITPRARHGATTAENLCLACVACNGHKHARAHARDPASGEAGLLFHPRQHSWDGHFAWNVEGTEIIGLTPTGRATVVALNMNDPLIVSARALWVGCGAHPPPRQSC